ncbi:hypothetical protein EDD37DRAFT_586851 [Exophiala viscosa]|uniref:uncharacterized protein n=1 Tax=Exophiala viscosa TaxID=2486360 RepID=UPI002191B54E|nr:hypothetical protein EDD37DRAFT_586851 [Exophiala viscosa]
MDAKKGVPASQIHIPEYQDLGPVHIPASVSLESLSGKSVLVTGGAGGLGKAYAWAFVEAG